MMKKRGGRRGSYKSVTDPNIESTADRKFHNSRSIKIYILHPRPIPFPLPHSLLFPFPFSFPFLPSQKSERTVLGNLFCAGS